MLYYNAMMPRYMGPPIPQSVSKKPKNKKRRVTYPVKWHKRKKPFSCYLKCMFWRLIRRLCRKRKLQKKKQKKPSPSKSVSIPKSRHALSSSEKIDARDFWGSKYGSEWLFKDKKAGQTRLVEIIDAFKAVDLKYSTKRHPALAPFAEAYPVCNRHRRRLTSDKTRQSHSHCELPSCNYQKNSRPTRVQRVTSKHSDSDWSISSSQFEPRPYSRWPPTYPKKLKTIEEPLSSVLSRMNLYLYNWVYVDRMQCSPSSAQFAQSLNTLEKYQQKLKRHYQKKSRASSVASSCSSTCCSQRHISKNPKEMYVRWQKRARKKAKERASILWLLAKAYDEIPSDLQEPFYRDQEQHRKLKPNIVHSLATAELYCRALANIYNDPNYNNLDHHSIIQAISRKGICLAESRDIRLTETILVQTAPLKIKAHMAVINGMISLYIKEVLIPEKIVEVIKEFSHFNLNSEMPSNSEEAAVLWINKCCVTLQSSIEDAIGKRESFEKPPRIPTVQEIADVSDGCSLAAVISFYCPKYLRWQEITFKESMSLGDSIYNLQLVKRFCCDHLPHYVDCLTLEDLLYVHPSIKDNVLVFVAELLFSFVIWPADCVRTREPQEYSHISSDVSTHKSRSSSIPSHKPHQASGNTIPNLRSDSYGGSTSSLPELRVGSGSQNDTSKEPSEKSMKKISSDRLHLSPRLHRARSSGIVNGVLKSNDTSFSSFTNSGDNEDVRFSGSCRQTVPTSGSKFQSLTKDSPKSNDLNDGDNCMRSHKSFSNVPEQLNDPRMNSGLRNYYRNLANSEGPIRSGSLTNIRENRVYESIGNERPHFKVQSSISSQSSGIGLSDLDKHLPRTSFAQCRDPTSNAINIIYMQHDKEGRGRKPLKPHLLQKSKTEKHTTFAALPNTTTWQKLALSSSSSQTDSGHETPIDSVNPSLRVKLAVIKMQLDEKRREIELEKKRLEIRTKKQRQKLGKVAFMQAVGIAEVDTPDSGTGKEIEDIEPPHVPEKTFDVAVSSPSLVRRMSIQEIAEDLDTIQKKWLDKHKVPIITNQNLHEDIETEVDDSLINPSDYQASIEILNSSLHDLQADISRISIEQEHVENLMQDSVEDASFYLHGHSKTPTLDSLVKMWGPNSSHSTPCGRPLSKDFSPSPVRQIYQKSPVQKQIHFSRDDSFVPHQDRTINIEELYSKVIKPENRQKSKPSKLNCNSPAEQTCTRPASYRLESSLSKTHLFGRQHSYDSSPRRPPRLSSEQQEAPEVPPKQALKEVERFYIPLDAKSKKSTTNWVKAQMNGNDTQQSSQKNKSDDTSSYGFIIGADLVNPDPETEVEMLKKKEQIMNLSIKRRVDHENRRATKEQEYARLKEEEQRKKDISERKREEERKRREAILEQYRQRKLQEKADEESSQDTQSTGKLSKTRSSSCLQRRSDNRICSDFTKPIAELRNQVALQKRNRTMGKTRPKSAYVNSSSSDHMLVDGTVVNKRNSQFITSLAGKGIPEFDIDSLNSGSTDSYKDKGEAMTQHNNNNNDGLRPPEIGGCSSDGASDTTSNSSNMAVASEYTGPKLFVKPTSKSNRSIIINALHAVLAGAVNSETKRKVLEEINKSDSKHFLILFRGAGCQFRALYSYNPDTGEVLKMYGIGPKSVSDKVMERFYKYNSGGKCFSEIQTKHLTVTIDAFTIPNSLWAGKKVVPPRKEFF